ncbi:hypothetical protein Plhal304r1_c014g0053581 [Plasmopara halstedii]
MNFRTQSLKMSRPWYLRCETRGGLELQICRELCSSTKMRLCLHFYSESGKQSDVIGACHASCACLFLY